ncbi:MAG: hypothetical protein ISS26_04345 [Candidatus Omnitrophica bacterium]|nr:hypothetical protein [Candidatus Omnitrophota bacterium]
MNFIAICLHCLDMRDFHSNMRKTPFLDGLRAKSVFMPMGRGHSHHMGDSLNAEMTGIWTARFTDSIFTERGFKAGDKFWFPKTVIEYLQENDYDILTCVGKCKHDLGSHAIKLLRDAYLIDEPERLLQFNHPREMDVDEWLAHIKGSKRFYAHIFLRETHRPWTQDEELCPIIGRPRTRDFDSLIFCARRAALEKPDEFAALRRRGLEKADERVKKIFEATKDIKDVTYIVYSNHGEVYDHFRYNLPYLDTGDNKIEGTSHGSYPYEVLYANMQMWIIPGERPRVINGIGRSIDFAPTVLEIGGIKPKFMDGESMLDYFSKGVFPDRARYAENRWTCMSMVRKDNFKIISTGFRSEKEERRNRYGPAYHRLAVFDLKADPYEYVNLIDTAKGKELHMWAMDEYKRLKDAGIQRCLKYELSPKRGGGVN